MANISNKLKFILFADDTNVLYFVFIQGYVHNKHYACEIWGNNYNSSIDKVILLQKRAIRIVDKANYRDHTEPLFLKK